MDLDTFLFSKRFPLYFGPAFEHNFGGNNPISSYGGNGYGFNNIAMSFAMSKMASMKTAFPLVVTIIYSLLAKGTCWLVEIASD